MAFYVPFARKPAHSTRITFAMDRPQESKNVRVVCASVNRENC